MILFRKLCEATYSSGYLNEILRRKAMSASVNKLIKVIFAMLKKGVAWDGVKGLHQRI